MKPAPTPLLDSLPPDVREALIATCSAERFGEFSAVLSEHGLWPKYRRIIREACSALLSRAIERARKLAARKGLERGAR